MLAIPSPYDAAPQLCEASRGNSLIRGSASSLNGGAALLSCTGCLPPNIAKTAEKLTIEFSLDLIQAPIPRGTAIAPLALSFTWVRKSRKSIWLITSITSCGESTHSLSSSRSSHLMLTYPYANAISTAVAWKLDITPSTDATATEASSLGPTISTLEVGPRTRMGCLAVGSGRPSSDP